MRDNGKSIVFEDVKIAIRNFAGRETMYNSAGKRSFAILLNEEDAKYLNEMGYNVKRFKPRNDDEIGQAFIKVAVNFDGPKPPKIVIINSKGKTVLDKDDVEILDWAEIASVDVAFTPYTWEMAGRSGLAAYLKTLYVTVVEDEFESKYADDGLDG